MNSRLALFARTGTFAMALFGFCCFIIIVYISVMFRLSRNGAGLEQSDYDFLHKTLLLAEEGAQEGFFPVGAVLVLGGDIVGSGFNRNYSLKLGSSGKSIMPRPWL